VLACRGDEGNSDVDGRGDGDEADDDSDARRRKSLSLYTYLSLSLYLSLYTYIYIYIYILYRHHLGGQGFGDAPGQPDGLAAGRRPRNGPPAEADGAEMTEVLATNKHPHPRTEDFLETRWAL